MTGSLKNKEEQERISKLFEFSEARWADGSMTHWPDSSSAVPRAGRRVDDPMTQFLVSDLEFDSEFCLDNFGGDHLDGVPRAAIQEGAIGAFASALLAADAGLGVNLDAAKRRVIFVGDPIHAIFDGAVGHAGR